MLFCGSMARRLALLAALPLMLILLVAACGGDDDLDRVVLALDWFPNADHAGIYVAQAQGFFEDEGLKVVLQVPSNPEDPPKFVATGRADFAISYEPDVIQAKAQGLPIVAVAAIVPVPLNSIQVLKSSGLSGPGDLAGKRIAYPGIPSNEAYLATVLRHAGVDPDSVELVNVGFDLGPALRGGRVDATIGSYWNVEAVEAELKGFPVDVIRLQDWGVPTYDELVFIVSEKAASENGDTIRRFLRAIARGHQFAVSNPDAAIDAVAVANPEMERELIDRGVRLLTPLWAEMRPFGRLDESKWQSFVDFLYDNQLIEERVPLDTLMTNEFIPE
jgi:putative hydroxymethylpyrimidine transport system substrate-binding protein